MRKQDIVEGLDVLIAVLNRDAVAETDALGLVVKEPLCGLAVDEKSLVLSCVGQRSERGDPVRAVDDDDCPVLFGSASMLT